MIDNHGCHPLAKYPAPIGVCIPLPQKTPKLSQKSHSPPCWLMKLTSLPRWQLQLRNRPEHGTHKLQAAPCFQLYKDLVDDDDSRARGDSLAIIYGARPRALQAANLYTVSNTENPPKGERLVGDIPQKLNWTHGITGLPIQFVSASTGGKNRGKTGETGGPRARYCGVPSNSILSRDPNLSRKPPETQVEHGPGFWKER